MAEKKERHGAALTRTDDNGDVFGYVRVSCVIKVHLGNAEELSEERNGQDWFHASEVDKVVDDMSRIEIGGAVLEHLDIESVIRHDEPITDEEIDLD